jgi:hypothetical protein
MIVIRIMTESVPGMPEMSKCEHMAISRDPHACLGEPCQDAGVGGAVGDQLVHRPDLADPGEGHQPDLGAVGDDDDRAGTLDQRPVRVRLHLVMCREAGFEGDPVRAHEHDVQVELREACFGDRPNQLIGLGPGHPACHHELQAGAHRHLRRDVQRVRDQCEALMVDKRPRYLCRGGPTGEPDRLARGHARRGLVGDPELLVLVPAALIAERKLIEDPLRDRASVCPPQQVLALEKAEVTTDCRSRYTEFVRNLGDVHAAVPGQPLQDRL